MSNIPKNCDECHDKEWCDSFYGGVGCEYEHVIVSEKKIMSQAIKLKPPASLKDAIDAAEKLKKAFNYDNDKNIEEDVVKEPEHYKHGRFQTIDEMIIVFGPQRTYDYCIMAAWKYRARANYKENFEQDMRKADEYLELARQIQEANKEVFFGSFNLIKE